MSFFPHFFVSRLFGLLKGLRGSRLVRGRRRGFGARLGTGLFRRRDRGGFPQVLQGQERVLEHNAGSGKAHDLRNLFLVGGLVAVHLALGAHGLVVTEGAARQTLEGVVGKFLTLRELARPSADSESSSTPRKVP